MTGDPDPAARRAAEAFELLGNEIRTAILLALADEGPASFSTLRERVGVADSGRFNYHLGQLTDQFVRKGADGYRLAYHGERVARAVLAGTFTETASFDPVPVEGTCPSCGAAALHGAYADGHVTVACAECPEQLLSVAFPPTAVIDRSPAAALRAFEHWARRRKELAIAGVCPDCVSRVDAHIDPDPPAELDLAPVARFECHRCGWTGCTTVGSVVVGHPTVAEFHDGTNTDPRERPYWDSDHWVTDRHEHVRSRDPWVLDVRFPSDEAELVVTVDGDLTVDETAITDR